MYLKAGTLPCPSLLLGQDCAPRFIKAGSFSILSGNILSLRNWFRTALGDQYGTGSEFTITRNVIDVFALDGIVAAAVSTRLPATGSHEPSADWNPGCGTSAARSLKTERHAPPAGPGQDIGIQFVPIGLYPFERI